MARKRINKNLVTILVLVGLGFVLLAFFIILSRFKDPQPFIDEAQTLIAQARQADAEIAAEVAAIPDPQQANERHKTLTEEKAKPLWDEAFKKLKEAQTYALRNSNQPLNLDIARQQAKMFAERRMYPELQQMWSYLLKQDPDLYDIRLDQATFYQQLGESGAMNVWPNLKAEADELIRINEKQQDVDPIGYLLKAQGLLGMVAVKTEENPDEALRQAEELLEGCREKAADRPLWYHLRGQLEMLRGRDLLEAAQQECYAKAGEYYQAAISAMPDNSKAYLNKLRHYSLAMLQLKFQHVARMQDLKAQETALEESRAQAQSVLAEADAAAKRFPDEPEFMTFKAQVLLTGDNPWRRLDEAIGLYEQAIKSQRADGVWLVNLAAAYLQRHEYPSLGPSHLQRVYELLQKAVYHPDLLDMDGPRQGLVRSVRYSLALPSLINVCIQLAQDAGSDEAARAQYLSVAQGALKELQDRFPEKNALVLLPQGKLALAQDKREEGLQYLYQADQQVAAAGQSSADLKATLFRSLRGTTNHGLALQYGLEALRSGNRTERMYFEYAQALLDRPDPTNMQILGEILKEVERQFGAIDGARQRILRLQAEWQIRQGEFEAAQKSMAALTEKDFELQLLWAQAQPVAEQRVEMLEQLRQTHPEHPTIVQILMSYYVSKYDEAKDARMLAQARTVVDAALAKDPENIIFRRYHRLLDEPTPTRVSDERAREITLEILEATADPFERNRRLGAYYHQMWSYSRSTGDEAAAKTYADKALEYLQTALELQPDNMEINSNLFTLNLALHNQTQVEAILSKVRSLDAVEARRFEAIGAIESENWSEAANRLGKYLEERPISSSAHLLLSQVYSALERKSAALSEAQLAVRQDDTNAAAHRQVALLLHEQYQQAGQDSLTLAQLFTIMRSLETVVNLTPQDMTCQQLRVLYYPLFIKLYEQRAQAMDATSPSYQAIQEQADKFRQEAIRSAEKLVQDNTQDPARRVLLANLYHSLSRQVKDGKDYLRLAEETYRTSLEELQQPPILIDAYRSFLVQEGRTEDAVALLQTYSKGEGDAETQWRVRLELAQTYLQSGNVDRAKADLQTMLQERPTDRMALILLGDVLRQERNYQEAAATYRKARDVQDDEFLAERHLETIMQGGELEQAKEALAQLRKTYPNYERLDLLEANLAILNADYGEALRLAEQSLQKNPDDTVVMLLLGRVQFYDAKYDQALDTFRGLRRKVGADNTTGQLDMARVLWMMRRYEEALTEVRGVVDKAPTPEARRMLTDMLQFLKRWSELERYYAELIKTNKDDVRLYLLRANAVIAQGDEALKNGQERLGKELYQRGLTELAGAVRMSKDLKQNRPEALSALLEAQLRFRDYEGMIRLADDNLSGEELDALLWGYKATALSHLKRQDEALALFEQSLERVKDKPALQNRLLEFMTRMQNPEQMIAWSQQRLSGQPDWIGLRLALSDLYRQQQDNEAWIKTLEDARALVKEPAGQLYIDRRLGTAYLVSGKTDKAIQILRQLVESQPKNVDILNNLAYLLLEKKEDVAEALKLAERAYNLAPTQATVMDTYALALLEDKDYTKAEWMLRRAIQQLQRDNETVTPEYYYHLGLALKGKGQKGEAAEQFEAALQGIRENLLSVGDAEALRKQIEQALKEE